MSGSQSIGHRRFKRFTGTCICFRKGQQVELAFAINLGAVTKLHRRTAVVAHVSRGGTGLMMDAYTAR